MRPTSISDYMMTPLSKISIAWRALLPPVLLAVVMVGVVVLFSITYRTIERGNTLSMRTGLAIEQALHFVDELHLGHTALYRAVSLQSQGVEHRIVSDKVAAAFTALDKAARALDMLASIDVVADDVPVQATRAAFEAYLTSAKEAANFVETDAFVAAMYLNGADRKFLDAQANASAIGAALAARRERIDKDAAAALASALTRIGTATAIGILLSLAVATSFARIVTAQTSAVARIAHMAHHDALTGLPNRTTFNENLVSVFESTQVSGKEFAVLCLDLDRFKEINDVFGHRIGDVLLCRASERLISAAQGAFVARLGGDEFVLVVSEGRQPADTEALAHRIFTAFADEFEIDGHRIRTGVSIGVAVGPNDGTDPATIVGNADAALYRAKADGRGTIRFFEAEMDRQLREKRALQQDLHMAISGQQLLLHYQPLATIAGEIIGFEALVRWRHPARGLIPPAVFIPLAEENGAIIAIGEWILREACREAASWTQKLNLSVNLSPVQFLQGDLPRLVHAALLESGLAANRLELEVTEGVLIGDHNRTFSILRRIKALGVRIAMDDFGTGYSSLSYLHSFPFDKIKIDRAFVSDAERNAQSAAIIRAVLGLARGLHLPVVAEGVETVEQLAFLAREDCDEVQGYLIGRPCPISDYAGIVGHGAETRHEIAMVS